MCETRTKDGLIKDPNCCCNPIRELVHDQLIVFVPMLQ